MTRLDYGGQSSKVKDTAGRRGGESVHVNASQILSSSVTQLCLEFIYAEKEVISNVVVMVMQCLWWTRLSVVSYFLYELTDDKRQTRSHKLG